MTTPPLPETPRLTFRRFAPTEADARLLFDLDADPEVVRYVGGTTCATVEAHRERIRDLFLPTYAAHPARGVFAAESGGEFVGWFLLRPATDHRLAAAIGWTSPAEVEVGYRLRREAWGRGLATEGAAALVRLAWADPAAAAVVACALEANRASTRVMEKAGLRRERPVTFPGFAGPGVVYRLARPGAAG